MANQSDSTVEHKEQVELPVVVEDEIRSKFEGLTIDEAKQVIFEVTNEIISDLKVCRLVCLKKKKSKK